MQKTWSCLVCALGLSLTATAQTFAQSRPASATTNSAAPDLVRLKDGSLLRGTISELRAGDSVTIVTVVGDVRKFSATDVAYAGPVSGEHPAPPSVTPAKQLATVTLLSEPEGLVFHRVTGLVLEDRRQGHVGHVYEGLCSAPCTIGLSPGVQQLALSHPGELPRRTTPVTIPSGSSEFHGYFESRLDLRIAGWTLIAGAVVTGAALMATATGQSAMNMGRFIAGMTVLAIGTPIGVLLALTPDVPHIDTRGPSSPPPGPEKAPGMVITGGF